MSPLSRLAAVVSNLPGIETGFSGSPGPDAARQNGVNTLYGVPDRVITLSGCRITPSSKPQNSQRPSSAFSRAPSCDRARGS